jgi:glycosyltransferase involved in cell wall biosynthesis
MRRHPLSGKIVVLETRVVAGSGGGPDKTILNTPRFLAGTDYHTVCAYMHPPGDPGFEQIRRKARQWDAPLLSVPDRGAWDLSVVTKMLDICRRERVAIWHGHDYKSNALGLLLSKFWKMRLVTTVHGWVHHTAKTPFYYWIDRVCLPRYDKVICVSEDLRERCLEFGVRPESCVLIENGIDTREFSRQLSVAEAKERLGVPPGRLLIGAVGRLSAEKGFDLLIRAVGRLLADGLDLELWIAGQGDEESQLRALTQELGIGERVKLLGYRSDTRELYQAMDVYALSSRREGLPNVLLEAMALEVPVVATRIAGVPLLVEDGKNGLLIEPGDEAALVEVLALMLRDEGRRTRLGKAGRATIEDRYGFTSRMGKIVSLYEQLPGPSITKGQSAV